MQYADDLLFVNRVRFMEAPPPLRRGRFPTYLLARYCGAQVPSGEARGGSLRLDAGAVAGIGEPEHDGLRNVATTDGADDILQPSVLVALHDRTHRYQSQTEEGKR